MAKKREEMSKLVFDVTEQQLACRDWTTLHSSKVDRATDFNYEKDLYSLQEPKFKSLERARKGKKSVN